METARYGSVRRVRDQTMDVENQDEEAEPLVAVVGADGPSGETSGSPGLPMFDTHIDVFDWFVAPS